MADEITVSTTLQLAVGSVSVLRQTTKTITQSTPRYAANVQNVGTTYEAVTIPADIATVGYATLVNTDATNFVDVGVEVAAAFYPLIRLKAGEAAVLRFATGTIFAKADTAAVNLELIVLAN